MKKTTAPTSQIQVRRCGFCQKTGHNKSTCQQKIDREDSHALYTETASEPTRQTVRQPLSFFVHHVQYQNHESPHVVNLKEQTSSLHHTIESAAPAEKKDFYFFHDTPKKTTLPQPAISFIPNKILAEAEKAKTQNPHIPAAPVATPKPQTTITYPARPSRTKQNLKKVLSHIKNAHQRTVHTVAKSVAPKHIVGISMAVLCLLFIPTHARTYYSNLRTTADQVSNNSTAGFSALHDSTSALMSGNLSDAQTSLTAALQNFDAAVGTINNQYNFLQKIVASVPVVNKEITGRQKLITAGQEISLGNTYLLKGLSEIKENTSSTLTANLTLIKNHLDASLPHYNTALTDLNDIDSDVLPFEYQDTFKEFRVLFNLYVQDLQKISQLSTAVQEIFGGKGLRRYLLVFQNPAEIRPTGGFAGSFALADIKDGQIVNIDIPAGGSYDLQGQLSEYVTPPTPLLLSNKRWEFQDANWFPDFSASAQKMLWFYRHSRNITADGVIAINATVLNRLLQITGPILSEDRNLLIDQHNALDTIQHIVEFGPEKKEKKPKQIISDLAGIFIENFKHTKPQDILPILINLEDALQKKEIQSYFTDQNTQRTMHEFGWTGEISATQENQDYMMVINTNIQGQKSDAKIKQHISHQAVVQPDGTILDSVVITRKHTGNPDEDLYGQTNIDYLRLYTPQGSELVRASGFTWPDERMFKAPENWYQKDIFLSQMEKEMGTDPSSGTKIINEFGKTSFGNWIITEPGQTSQVQFIYKLPFKAWSDDARTNLDNWTKIFQNQNPASTYQLIAQKQSGVDSEFESQVIYPDSWSPAWHNGLGVLAAPNGISVSNTTLNQDQIWSLVMKKNE